MSLFELTSRVLLPHGKVLSVFFFPFYFFLMCPALPHLYFFFICPVLAVLLLPCPSSALIPCRYKLPPYQQFLHGASMHFRGNASITAVYIGLTSTLLHLGHFSLVQCAVRSSVASPSSCSCTLLVPCRYKLPFQQHFHMKLEGAFLALTAAAVCLPYFFFFSHLRCSVLFCLYLQVQAAIPAALLHGALERISGTDRSFGPSSFTCADPSSSASTCRYKLPSQQHFYMEPQGALVLPDEAGTFTVTSSTQSLDAVQKAVAETLGIPWHKVTAGLNLLDSSSCAHSVMHAPLAVLHAGRHVTVVQVHL